MPWFLLLLFIITIIIPEIQKYFYPFLKTSNAQAKYICMYMKTAIIVICGWINSSFEQMMREYERETKETAVQKQCKYTQDR